MPVKKNRDTFLCRTERGASIQRSTFHNDRQKAEVSVLKGQDTANPLDGGVLACMQKR